MRGVTSWNDGDCIGYDDIDDDDDGYNVDDCDCDDDDDDDGGNSNGNLREGQKKQNHKSREKNEK